MARGSAPPVERLHRCRPPVAAEGVAPPIAVVLTHSDGDHVFGAVEVGAPVIAHRLTVGGDHAADSSVIYVKQNRLLFLGDAL